MHIQDPTQLLHDRPERLRFRGVPADFLLATFFSGDLVGQWGYTPSSSSATTPSLVFFVDDQEWLRWLAHDGHKGSAGSFDLGSAEDFLSQLPLALLISPPAAAAVWVPLSALSWKCPWNSFLLGFYLALCNKWLEIILLLVMKLKNQ